MLTSLMSNLLFLIFPIFLYQLFSEGRHRLRRDGLMMLVLGTTSAMMCMTFPVEMSEGHWFDFRQTALIVASFYGGFGVSLAMAGIMVAYQWWMGGGDFYSTILSLTVLYPIILFLIPRFRSYRSNIRTHIIMALSTLGLMLSPLSLFLFSRPLYTNEVLFSTVLGLLIQLLGTWVIVYFIETIKKNRAIGEEIRQVEKFRVISDLAASVSHEVRNPLTVTRGFLQLLQAMPRSEQESRYLSLALEELDRAQSIITDYLAYAKPEMDQLEVLQVEEEIAYVADVLQPYAALGKVEIETRCEESNAVLGERQKFRQCLINLLKNGIEAMPEGGRLGIRVQAASSKVEVEISDNGTGMTPDEVYRLGTPYHTTKDKGTGLGTMVAFSIIKAMNGRVDVKSSKGAGTQFTITLPQPRV